jgi:hypothetical protein
VADPQPAQPALRPQDALVDGPQRCAGDACLFGGLPFAGVVQRSAGDLGEVQMGPQHPQRSASPLAAPGGGLDAVAQRGENLVRLVPGTQRPAGADRFRGAGPHPADVVQGPGLPGTQSNVPGVPPALVLGMQQQAGELVDGSAGAGHVAGDGRGDPVPVLGRALAVLAQDQASAVGCESAVTAGGVAAGEVAEKDQIRRG